MDLPVRPLILGLAAALASGGAMAGTTTPIQCSVRTGAKLLAPMTSEAICLRFIGAFARASGTAASASASTPANGLVVVLDFRPQGVASAEIMRMRSGKASPPTSFNLAVSDRRFAADDIDQLAVSAARGLPTTAGRQLHR